MIDWQLAKLLQATLKDKIEKGDSMAFRTVRTRLSEHAANSSPAIKGSPLGEGIAGLIYSGSDSSSSSSSISSSSSSGSSGRV